jgi:hypothetical protein
MKVTIETISKTTNGLLMVKLIKDCTGLGLLESKSIMDNLKDRKVEIEVLDGFYQDKVTYIEHLKEVLTNGSTGGKYILSCFDLEYIREYKLLSLGIGERIDYEKFILYKMRNDDNFLGFILNKLTTDDLIEVFKQIEI